MSVGKTRDTTSILKALPGKHDIKIREPGFLFINLQVVLLFKLVIEYREYRFNVIHDVNQTVQRHDGPIKTHAADKNTYREKGNVYQVNVQQCS